MKLPTDPTKEYTSPLGRPFYVIGTEKLPDGTWKSTIRFKDNNELAYLQADNNDKIKGYFQV